MAACSSLKQMFVVTAFNNSYWLTIQGCNITDENAKMWIAPCSCWAYTRLDVEQRFSVPVFSIPNPVLRLSSLGTRVRFRFRDCPWLEHDSESGSETAQALNSIPIPVPRLHRLRTRFRFRDDSESWPESLGISVLIPNISLKKGLIWVKRALLEQNRGCN